MRGSTTPRRWLCFPLCISWLSTSCPRRDWGPRSRTSRWRCVTRVGCLVWVLLTFFAGMHVVDPHLSDSCFCSVTGFSWAFLSFPTLPKPPYPHRRPTVTGAYGSSCRRTSLRTLRSCTAGGCTSPAQSSSCIAAPSAPRRRRFRCVCAGVSVHPIQLFV